MIEISQKFKQKMEGKPDIHFLNPAYLIKSLKEISSQQPELEKILEATIQLGIPAKYINLSDGLPAEVVIHRWIHELRDFFPVNVATATQAVLLWGDVLGLNIKLDSISESISQSHFNEVLHAILDTPSDYEEDIKQLLALGTMQFEGLLRDRCGNFTREIYALLFTRKYVKDIRRTSIKNIDNKIDAIVQEMSSTTHLDILAIRAAVEAWAVLIRKKENQFDVDNEKFQSRPMNVEVSNNSIGLQLYGIFRKHTFQATNKNENLSNSIFDENSLLCAGTLREGDQIFVLSDKNNVFVTEAKSLLLQKNEIYWDRLFSFQPDESMVSALVLPENEIYYLITNAGRIKVCASSKKNIKKGKLTVSLSGSQAIVCFGKINSVEAIMLVTTSGDYSYVVKKNAIWRANNRWKDLLRSRSESEGAALYLEIDGNTSTIFAVSENGYLRRTNLNIQSGIHAGSLFKQSSTSGKLLTAFLVKPNTSTLHFRTKNHLVSRISVGDLPVAIKGLPKKFAHISSGDLLEELVIESDKNGIKEYASAQQMFPLRRYFHEQPRVALATLQTQPSPSLQMPGSVHVEYRAPSRRISSVSPPAIARQRPLPTEKRPQENSNFVACYLVSCAVVVLLGVLLLCTLLYWLQLNLHS